MWQSAGHGYAQCQGPVVQLVVSLLYPVTAWRTRVYINAQLSSISVFATDLKEFKLHKDYSGIQEQNQQIKPLQPVGQAAGFKFEFKLEPLQVI